MRTINNKQYQVKASQSLLTHLISKNATPYLLLHHLLMPHPTKPLHLKRQKRRRQPLWLGTYLTLERLLDQLIWTYLLLLHLEIFLAYFDLFDEFEVVFFR